MNYKKFNKNSSICPILLEYLQSRSCTDDDLYVDLNFLVCLDLLSTTIGKFSAENKRFICDWYEYVIRDCNQSLLRNYKMKSVKFLFHSLICRKCVNVSFSWSYCEEIWQLIASASRDWPCCLKMIRNVLNCAIKQIYLVKTVQWPNLKTNSHLINKLLYFSTDIKYLHMKR